MLYSAQPWVMYLRLIAECYANKCFADRLKDLLLRLGERETHRVNVFHKHYLGRDRILNEVFKLSRIEKSLQIVIIDYERGIARKYVEASFELRMVHEKILVGAARNFKNTVAVVFDPNIEEAFLCRIDKTLCYDENKVRLVKSRRACNLLEKVLEQGPADEILNKLAREIKNICCL